MKKRPKIIRYIFNFNFYVYWRSFEASNSLDANWKKGERTIMSNVVTKEYITLSVFAVVWVRTLFGIQYLQVESSRYYTV
jgi:hypothetical protein